MWYIYYYIHTCVLYTHTWCIYYYTHTRVCYTHTYMWCIYYYIHTCIIYTHVYIIHIYVHMYYIYINRQQWQNENHFPNVLIHPIEPFFSKVHLIGVVFYKTDFGFLLLLFLPWLLWPTLPKLCWIEVVRVGTLVLFLILGEMLSIFRHWG